MFLHCNLYSQDHEFASVIEKLKKDEKTFLQFQKLGEKHCINPDSFEEEYIKGYNSMNVMNRFLNQSALKTSFQNIENGNKTQEKCICLYQRKNRIKKQYNKVISNKLNYNIGEDYDMTKYIQDYLKYDSVRVDFH